MTLLRIFVHYSTTYQLLMLEWSLRIYLRYLLVPCWLSVQVVLDFCLVWTCTVRLLIISASTGTWYFAAVAVLNMYVVHNLNGLDAYTLHTVHEQDSVMTRHKRKNYTCANVICAYIALMLLASISQNFLSDSHASVKFKLSCCMYVCCMYQILCARPFLQSHTG